MSASLSVANAQCITGYYGPNEGSCTSCPGNTISAAGSTVKTNCACAPGAIGYNGSFCFFISCTSSSSCYHVSVGAYLFSANFCLSYVWNVQSLSCYLGRCLPGTSSTCSTFSNPLPEFHGGTWYFGYEKATYTVQNELSLEI